MPEDPGEEVLEVAFRTLSISLGSTGSVGMWLGKVSSGLKGGVITVGGGGKKACLNTPTFSLSLTAREPSGLRRAGVLYRWTPLYQLFRDQILLGSTVLTNSSAQSHVALVITRRSLRREVFKICCAFTKFMEFWLRLRCLRASALAFRTAFMARWTSLTNQGVALGGGGLNVQVSQGAKLDILYVKTVLKLFR